jgi:hypothetical protein
MSNLEVLLESQKFKKFLKQKSLENQLALQKKIEDLQNIKKCNNDSIICVLGETKPYECGFGCQMHQISSGFFCSLEKNVIFNIKNYESSLFQKYLINFNNKCQNKGYNKSFYISIYKLF